MARIQAVAMDMWDPYVPSVREHVPEADDKGVFDKFHVAKHLGEAVDRVRRRVNKSLRVAGDHRPVGTCHDWLRHPARMEPKDRHEFTAPRNSNLKTAQAWAMKEAAMAVFSYGYERPARKDFRSWHGWAVRSRLQPMMETARMLKRRLENLLTHLRHRITNAASESINSKIEWVKYTAQGFRNKRTSGLRSTSTVAAWTRHRHATRNPEEPHSAELLAGVVAELDAHEAALQALLVTRGTDSASASPRPAAQEVADADSGYRASLRWSDSRRARAAEKAADQHHA